MKSSIGMFGDGFLEEPKPPVERKPRLTIEVMSWTEWHGIGEWKSGDRDLNDNLLPWYWRALLDGRAIGGAEAVQADTEHEARAAAQAYVDELVKHFREGGT